MAVVRTADSFLADLDSYDDVFKSRSYIDILHKLDALFEYHNSGGVDDPELIIDCNALSVEIDKEIVKIHTLLRYKYLGLLSPEPSEYARIVTSMDRLPALVGELEGLLPSVILRVFSCWRLGKALEACDKAVALHSSKKKLLNFVHSRVGYVAPNLDRLVGSPALTVKLIGTAGGLTSLAKMLTPNIRQLGAKRKRASYINQIDMVQSAPPSLRQRVCYLLSFKCKVAAREDSTRECPTGQLGTTFRKQIREELDKSAKRIRR